MTHLFPNLLLELRLQNTVQKASFRITVKQSDDAFPLLNGSERFVVAQLAREQEIHILLAVLAQTAEHVPAAACANGHRGDHHVAGLFALGNGDGEALWVAETEADAVDYVEQRLGLGEAHDAAHACACAFVAFDCRGGDGAAGVLACAEVEGCVLDVEL